MRVMTFFKVLELFLTLGLPVPLIDCSDNRAEDAFGVARGVLSGAGGVGGNSDHDVAAEVARVRSCREQLVELIVESRHRHLRRWRRMAATQSSKPGRILVATGALDIDVRSCTVVGTQTTASVPRT